MLTFIYKGSRNNDYFYDKCELGYILKQCGFDHKAKIK